MQGARELNIMKITALALVSALVFLASALPCYADNSIYRESNNKVPNTLAYSHKTNTDEYCYVEQIEIKQLSNGIYTAYVSGKKIGISSIKVTGGASTIYGNEDEPLTFNVQDDEYYRIWIYTTEQVEPNQIELMVNVGTEPLPYEPYWEGYKIVYGDIAEQAGTSFEPVLQIVVPYTLLLLGVVIAVYCALRIARRAAR